MATTYANSVGYIEPHVLYRETEFARRMGWGRKALTAAKQRGLKVMRSGKGNYVLGRDGIEFIERDHYAKLQLCNRK